MIAGNDERIALVIETQAKLEGIRAARAELVGLGRMASDQARASRTDAQVRADSMAVLRGEFGRDIAALKEYGATVDGTNKRAVSGFRESVEAQRALMVEAKASTAQFQQLDAVLAQVERRSKVPGGRGSLVDPQTGQQFDRLSPKLRTAANAATTLSFAASSAQGGLAGAASAAGILAQSVASLSTSARIAASAAGVGALVTVGVALLGVWRAAKSEIGSVSETFRERMGFLGAANSQRMLAQAGAERDAAVARAGKTATGDIRDILPFTESGKAQRAALDAITAYRELYLQVQQVQRAERIRSRAAILASREEITQRKSELKLAKDKTDVEALHVSGRSTTHRTVRLNQLKEEEAAAQRSIRQQFVVLDANGQELALNREQANQRKALLDLNEQIFEQKRYELILDNQRADAAYRHATFAMDASQNARTRFEEKLDLIKEELLEEEKSGISREMIEERAQIRIRNLRRETYEAAKSNAAALEAVLIGSASRQAQNIGNAIRTMRRIILGFEAADATIKGLKEGAAAIAALARWDLRGAALHGAAAVEFAAVAAKAAQEAGGGGGGGGGGGRGGGGGGGGGGSSTFEPRVATSGPPVAFTLIMRDRSGRETARQTIDDLTRYGALKMPGADLIVGSDN